jgi:hypothetical protein
MQGWRSPPTDNAISGLQPHGHPFGGGRAVLVNRRADPLSDTTGVE